MSKEKIIGWFAFIFLIFIVLTQTSYSQISAPHNLQGTVKGNTVTINWIEPASRNAVSYNIYRVISADTSKNTDVTHFNFSKINSTTSPIYQDSVSVPAGDFTTAVQAVAVYYYVTAVDVAGQESVPSQILRIVLTPVSQMK